MGSVERNDVEGAGDILGMVISPGLMLWGYGTLGLQQEIWAYWCSYEQCVDVMRTSGCVNVKMTTRKSSPSVLHHASATHLTSTFNSRLESSCSIVRDYVFRLAHPVARSDASTEASLIDELQPRYQPPHPRCLSTFLLLALAAVFLVPILLG